MDSKDWSWKIAWLDTMVRGSGLVSVDLLAWVAQARMDLCLFRPLWVERFRPK